MEKAVDEALRARHEFIALPEFGAEIDAARKDFFSKVGAPLRGEPLEEARYGSMTEWFILDRPLEGAGHTALQEYMHRNGDDVTRERFMVLQGLAKTVHSVFEVKKKSDAGVYLRDLYTGVKYKQARRVPFSLGKGDLAELRLVAVSEGWFATDAVCVHPYVARKQITKKLKLAHKQGEPIAPLLMKLMAMNTQYERYRKTVKTGAYEGLL